MKEATIGKRIKAIRGGMSQAEFGKLLDSSQGAVSSWENDDDTRSPSALIFLRLAALTFDPDDSIFFLRQAEIPLDVVVSAAARLGKGGVDMEAILPVAEQILGEKFGFKSQRELEGKDFIVPPFKGTQPAPFDVSVAASLVSSLTSTFYIIAMPTNPFSGVGHGVAPGDIVVFDSREVSSCEEIAGEKVLGEFEDGLFVGRLAYIQEGASHHLAVGPADRPPGNWGYWAFHSDDVRIIESRHAPGSHPDSRSRREAHKGWRYWGIWIAQFSTGTPEFWKRRAKEHRLKQ